MKSTTTRGGPLKSDSRTACGGVRRLRSFEKEALRVCRLTVKAMLRFRSGFAVRDRRPRLCWKGQDTVRRRPPYLFPCPHSSSKRRDARLMCRPIDSRDLPLRGKQVDPPSTLNELVRRSSGEVRVGNTAVTCARHADVRRVRASVGTVFQDFNSVRLLTALENVLSRTVERPVVPTLGVGFLSTPSGRRSYRAPSH